MIRNRKAGNTIFSLLTVLFFTAILFGFIAETSSEVLNNPLLDNQSISAIATLNTQIASVDISEATIVNNVTVNSTFEGTDAFQREFLESKSIAEGENKNLIEKITGVPNLLVTAMGIPQNDALERVLSIIFIVLLVLLVLVVYKGWKTGQVD